LGIRATPTFAIDGEGIEGALPLDIFQRILREKAAR
jgi:predicted DsbA family dithiol-disulfide isomerase